MKYEVGQWVRLKADYGANSDDKMDKAAADLVGQITDYYDGLYYWQTGNGYLQTCVYASEIEAVVYAE